MFSEKDAKIRAHGNNIRRYERLLETSLSELERQYIERRLSQERDALASLTGSTPSMFFPAQRGADGVAVIVQA